MVRKDVAVCTIDRCLHYICLTQKRFIEIGGLSAILHLFFHVANKNKLCNLEIDAQAELSKIQALPPIFDFVELNFKDGFMLPIFSLSLDKQAVADIVSGNIRVFSLMDFEDFIRMGREMGIPMRWATPKEIGSVDRYASCNTGVAEFERHFCRYAWR